MDALTERQRQLLTFIIGYIDSHGYPPTLREMGAHMGIRSTNGVNDHLVAMERNGYIRRRAHKSRAVRVVRRPDGLKLDALDGRIFQALQLLHGEPGFRPALERALVRLRAGGGK